MRYDIDFWTQFAATFTDEWREHAACLGMDGGIFFDEDKIEQAKRICSQCSVFWDCVDDAIWYDDSEGVRGFTSKERSSITMHRKRTIKAFRYDLGILDE